MKYLFIAIAALMFNLPQAHAQYLCQPVELPTSLAPAEVEKANNALLYLDQQTGYWKYAAAIALKENQASALLNAMTCAQIANSIRSHLLVLKLAEMDEKTKQLEQKIEQLKQK